MDLCLRATLLVKHTRCFARVLSPIASLKVRNRPSQVLLSHCRLKVHWSVYNMACPGNRLRFDLTAEDLQKESDRLMIEAKNVYDNIGNLKIEDVTYDNVAKVRMMVRNISI